MDFSSQPMIDIQNKKINLNDKVKSKQIIERQRTEKKLFEASDPLSKGNQALKLYKEIAKEVGGKYSNYLATPIKLNLAVPLDIDTLFGPMEQPFIIFLAKAPVMRQISLWGG